MLCCICKKKEAVVHYAEIVEGSIQKLDLCEECAVEKGVGPHHFSMGKLLAGMTGQDSEQGIKSCHACGMNLDEFKKLGRLGCEKCYDAFWDVLSPMLEQIHRSNKHKGKGPSVSQDKSIDMENRAHLEKELKEAISAEDFEKAAYLRDEIKKLK